MSWLLHPEVISLTIAILALVGVLALAFAFSVQHRLAWSQLPAAARDAELQTRVQQRETELLEKERRIEQLTEQMRDHEAKMLERDQLESEAEYWKTQIEATKAEHAMLDEMRAEIEEVRESYRQELENLADTERQSRESQSAAEDARMRVAEAERRLAQIEDEDVRQREKQQELTQAVAELEDRLTAKKAELAATQEALEPAQERVTSLERKWGELTAAQEALQDKLTRSREDLQTVQTALEGLETARAKLSETKDKLTQAEKDVREKYESINKLRSEEEWLNALIARKREELGELTGADPASSDDTDDPSLADLVKPSACLASEAENGVFEPVLPYPQTDERELDALDRVSTHLTESGLIFDKRVINAFHTSLKTAVISPLTVLAGISGTGKSQLPRFYAEAMGMHFLKIPVQPRWDGPQDLFGFYNYIEKRYKATDLARTLVHLDPYNWPEQAKAFRDRMLLVLLDEMNLARVEYYFSEFLSRLEGRPKDKDAGNADIRRPAEIEIDVSRKGQTKRVYAGQNILFVGTMNEDESTLSLSDKVLDRANMLRFPKPKKLNSNIPTVQEQHMAKGYLPKSRWTDNWMRNADQMTAAARERTKRTIVDINAIMDGMGRPYGHRMGQAIMHYVANYPALPNSPEAINAALADQIELRILPRLRGILVDEHRNRLSELADVAKQLDDEALAEAINSAIQQSRDTNGLFSWRGFTRY